MIDDSSNEDEEQENMLLMTSVHSDTESELVDDDEIKVLFYLTCDELISMLNEFLSKSHIISSKHRNLKKVHHILIEECKSLEKKIEIIEGKIDSKNDALKSLKEWGVALLSMKKLWLNYSFDLFIFINSHDWSPYFKSR